MASGHLGVLSMVQVTSFVHGVGHSEGYLRASLC